MLRAVLDANVFVSAVINPRGTPAQLLAALDSFDLVISEAILAEVGQVLLYPKIAKRHGRTREQVQQYAEDLARVAILTPGNLTLHVVAEDSTDDRYLEAAIEGEAGYLVSGDKHLLRLKGYRGVQILTTRQFLKVLREATP